MTDATGKTAELDPATVNRNRLVLLTIAGIPVTMILAASWLWYFVVNGELDLVGTLGTANNGELLEPFARARDSGHAAAGCGKKSRG